MLPVDIQIGVHYEPRGIELVIYFIELCTFHRFHNEQVLWYSAKTVEPKH